MQFRIMLREHTDLASDLGRSGFLGLVGSGICVGPLAINE